MLDNLALQDSNIPGQIDSRWNDYSLVIIPRLSTAFYSHSLPLYIDRVPGHPTVHWETSQDILGTDRGEKPLPRSHRHAPAVQLLLFWDDDGFFEHIEDPAERKTDQDLNVAPRVALQHSWKTFAFPRTLSEEKRPVRKTCGEDLPGQTWVFLCLF